MQIADMNGDYPARFPPAMDDVLCSDFPSLPIGRTEMPYMQQVDSFPYQEASADVIAQLELTPGSVYYPFDPPDNSGKWKWNSDVAQWVYTTEATATASETSNTWLWILLGIAGLVILSGNRRKSE
jgi:hypothetical protein